MMEKIFTCRLEYEQSRLLGQMEKLVTTFDAELRLVRDEKFKLDTVMKNADLRSDIFTFSFSFSAYYFSWHKLVPLIFYYE